MAKNANAASIANGNSKAVGNGTKANGAAVPPARSTSEENIFIFYPNLIGYSRIVLALASLYYMPVHPRTCSFLYSISCILDALDGYAARKFEQSTKFGAVLDMVTDRCTTSCLLVFLASAFPVWSPIFQGLISLDFTSHYMHMYTTLTMGGSGQSHKKILREHGWLSALLNVYYSNNKVLFTLCAMNELFFIALYLLSFSSPILTPALLVTGNETSGVQPGSPMMPSMFLPSGSAGAMEMARANKMDSAVPWALAGISCPFMLIKQFINVVQLVYASQWLAEGDRAERKRLGLPRTKKAA